MVILSASGMATGGRVLHHLAQRAGNHRNMILLTGFQAPGTRGAALGSGARSVRIHGRDVALKAEVVQLVGVSPCRRQPIGGLAAQRAQGAGTGVCGAW